MKIWVDDVRPAPDDSYHWVKSVNQAKSYIEECEYMHNVSRSKKFWEIEVVDLDHDAGEYADHGGDYIKLLDWFEETGRNYSIRIHSMNPVGVENMRRIIRRNGWTEVK